MVFERMGDAVQGRGCAERLRSRDKIDKDEGCSDDMRNDAGQEKKKKRCSDDMRKNMRSNAGEEKKKCSDDMKKNMRNDTGEEKKKCSDDMKKNMRNDAGEEMSNCDNAQQRENKKMLNGNKKPKSRKVSSAFFEKERKKRLSVNIQNGPTKKKSDDGSDKKKTVPLSLNKNKVKKGEMSKRTLPNTPVVKERKMRLSDNMEMKSDDGSDKKKTMPLFVNKNKVKKGEMSKRSLPNTPVVNERKTRPSDSMEMKMKMKKKKRDASFVHPEERASQTFSTNNKEKKRKAPSTPLRREQKMREASSDDKKKAKKASIVAKGNEKKTCSAGKKKKRKAPFAFFKFMCNKFKELLFIPPAVAPSYEDLINHHAYLEDSEGKFSKIRLSVVDGSLAFCEGWNNFVSEHLINWGDFLLFEYIEESTFSVRVFGTDCCERLHFNAESGRNGTMKKRKERHTLSDDLVSRYNGQDSEDIYDVSDVSGESCRRKEPEITVDAEMIPNNLAAKSINTASETQDLGRAESEVGHESLVALDNTDRNLSDGECKTRSDSVFCIQEQTKRSEVITITDEASSTQQSEDTMKQRTSSEASEAHHMPINTQKEPQRVGDGVWHESSVAQNNKMGNLILEKCKNNAVSPICSAGRTNGSEIIPSTNAIPLTQKDIDTEKLNTFSCLKEGRSTTREPELAATTPTECTEIHDLEEDSRQKHQRNTIEVKSTIAMDKYPNNSEMNSTGNISRLYEAPGGSRCLEKWKEDIVSGQAAHHDIGQVTPEKPQKAGEKLVGNCGAMGQIPVDPQLESDVTDTSLKSTLNIPTEQLLILDRVLVSKCEDSRTEANHFVNQKGATVQLQTKKEPLKSTCNGGNRQGDKILVSVNRVLAHQSELQIPQQENENFAGCVIPVALPPAEAELLDLNDHSLQFCISCTNKKWIELPKSIPKVILYKGWHDRNVIILKDPMKRLWPVFYYEKPIFVGFTAGWKPFAEANNLQAGDVCKLVKELDEDDPAYQVHITRN